VPSRVLRAGAVTSDKLNAISAAAALLFYNMLTVADDFGLIELTPAFIKMRCFPGRAYTLEEMAELIEEIVRIELVRDYHVLGKRYAAIGQWDQTRWAKLPLYPRPPWPMDHIVGGYVAPRARQPEASESTAPANATVAKMRGNGAWWKDPDGVRAKFIELGLQVRTGETIEQAKERCFEEINRRKHA
jgi:hypothetical protein